jgi:phosphoglycolate phosphatase
MNANGFTVVFDLDGTLADTAPDLVATLNHVLASAGHAPLSEAHARPKVGAGARALLAEGLKAVGAPSDDTAIDPLFHRFLDHYEQNIAHHTRLYPGAVEAMDRLSSGGFRLAVCTNKLQRHSKRLLQALAIDHRFGAICGRDSFAYFKPDPRHFSMTVTQSGGAPHRAVMIGDSKTDIDTARNAKVPVIGVTFGYSDLPIEELGPDRVIGHFDELYEAVQALTGKASA